MIKYFKDGSGYISKGEFRKAMKKQAPKMKKAQIDDLIKESDTDGDGEIDYEEFFALMVKQ